MSVNLRNSPDFSKHPNLCQLRIQVTVCYYGISSNQTEFYMQKRMYWHSFLAGPTLSD